MILRADARRLPLIDGCVQTCVTSPPYWGLRDYGHGEQIGLEATPEAYVASIVSVFREVRRVLKDDGTAWLNLGDSYANTGGMTGGTNGKDGSAKRAGRMFDGGYRPLSVGLKQKDLCGIPWRVAFALQADGWYLRSDIVWAKPNPMPESVTDRPTKSHEYLFLLAKSERYYYDADAIKEPYAESTLREAAQGYHGEGLKDYAAAGVQNPSDTKRRIIESIRRQDRKNDTHIDHRKAGVNEWDKRGAGPTVGRNKRSVWTIPTMPYSGAHFATMPEALVEPCILAGCPMGGLVLDPFCGSGTVLAVAERLGRLSVGCDLSYQDLAKKRTAQRGLRFAAPDDAPEYVVSGLVAEDYPANRSTCLDLDDESVILEELARA